MKGRAGGSVAMAQAVVASLFIFSFALALLLWIDPIYNFLRSLDDHYLNPSQTDWFS